jgi:hypothetical protein
MCCLCGKEFDVELDIDNPTKEGGYPYVGGNYFGRLFEATDQEAEIWECDECFNAWEDDFEDE